MNGNYFSCNQNICGRFIFYKYTIEVITDLDFFITINDLNRKQLLFFPR